MTPTRAPRLLLVVVAAALVVACGSPAPLAPPQDGTVPPTGGADAGGNLTDRCVDDYQPGVDYFPAEVSFTHTDGVKVAYHDAYKVVTVTEPWKNAERTFTYVLRQCGTPPEVVPADLSDAPVIEVPVKRAVTMSTTHLPAFDLLEGTGRLVGVGSTEYVSTPSVRRAVDAGEVVATGTNAMADVEKLVSLKPDLVMTYSTGDPAADEIDKMREAGLPVVLNGDFTADTALGRAEWLKFVALFLNEEADAARAFDGIAGDYRRVADRAAHVEQRPTVFLSTPFEGTWYMPPGDSATAGLLADAGADYVFADATGQAAGTGNLALDIETVLARSADTDFWLNTGTTAHSLTELTGVDQRFTKFAAFRRGNVYAETRRMSPGGGVDFYETGYTRPDLVLADLVSIFHPEVLADHELVFYRRLPRTAPGPSPGATAPATAPVPAVTAPVPAATAP